MTKPFPKRPGTTSAVCPHCGAPTVRAERADDDFAQQRDRAFAAERHAVAAIRAALGGHDSARFTVAQVDERVDRDAIVAAVTAALDAGGSLYPIAKMLNMAPGTLHSLTGWRFRPAPWP